MTRFKLIKWLHSIVINHRAYDVRVTLWYMNEHIRLHSIALCSRLACLALRMLFGFPFARNAFETMLFFTRFSGASGYQLLPTAIRQSAAQFILRHVHCRRCYLLSTLPATEVLPEKFVHAHDHQSRSAMLTRRGAARARACIVFFF